MSDLINIKTNIYVVTSSELIEMFVRFTDTQLLNTCRKYVGGVNNPLRHHRYDSEKKYKKFNMPDIMIATIVPPLYVGKSQWFLILIIATFWSDSRLY